MKKARSSVKNKKLEKKACDVDDNTMVTNDSEEMKNGGSGSGMRVACRARWGGRVAIDTNYMNHQIERRNR